jgi:dTDP-4-dehydrorhamnose 3,5-epimerase
MIIDGDIHKDERGQIRFINNFDLSQVKRMYAIEPIKDCIRAWQGHSKETKWFFVACGRFTVKTIDMLTNKTCSYELNAEETQVLKIPGGHYNGFKALEDNSILIVYSDFSLEDSKMDDHRVSVDTFPWE